MSDPRQHLDRIDAALEPLGFRRESGLGRTAWRGERGGRSWTIVVSPQSRTRYAGEVRVRQRLGYRVRADCTSRVATRLYFVKKRFASSALARLAYRWRRLAVIEDVPASIDGYSAVVREPAWARALLASPSALDSLGQLLEVPPSRALGSSVHLDPRTAHYASGIVQLGEHSPDQVLAAVRGLETLIEAAESLPPPADPAELGRLEQVLQGRPWLGAIALLGCLVGAVGLFALLFVGLFLLLR